MDGLRGSDTTTGRHLDDRAGLKESVRTSSGALEVRGASLHNLQGVDVDIPLGVLCVVTGVAGSGKSSLIHGSVAGRDGVVVIDQGAIKGSRRSNPATYTGLLDPIRKAFAKANGVKPALFSSNSEGACPNCNGAGVIFTELGVMATVESTCEECEGKRFQAAVLEYTLGGRNIAEVLAMSVEEAKEFFDSGEARTPAAHKILERLADVGLGYVSLGQTLTTLSGGERQRLKLATHLGEKGGVYVLDEPTTGLHLADVEHLLGLLNRLVDAGKSVIVIAHHQAVMAHADWIIDLGPGAGHDGGRVIFEGTPADLVEGTRRPHRQAPRGVRRRLTEPPHVTARRDEVDVAVGSQHGDALHQRRDPPRELVVITAAAVERVHVRNRGHREQFLDDRVDLRGVRGQRPDNAILHIAERGLCLHRHLRVRAVPVLEPGVVRRLPRLANERQVGERVGPDAVRHGRRWQAVPAPRPPSPPGCRCGPTGS